MTPAEVDRHYVAALREHIDCACTARAPATVEGVRGRCLRWAELQEEYTTAWLAAARAVHGG